MARPRTLRDSPRCRVPSLPSGVSASRGHRSLSPRVAHVSLRTPVTVCPHAPRLRSPRPSLLLPDGVSLSEPRSVRADVIPGSERHVTPATRQRGGGARRVDRGEEHRPPFGRAAERARSAARVSPGHPLHIALLPSIPRPSRRPVLTRGAASYPPGLAALSCALTSLRGLRFAWSPLAIASRRPRLAPNPGYCLPARSAAPLSPPLSSPAGWGVALGAAERAGRCYPRFGAARHPCHASAGRGSAPRRPG